VNIEELRLENLNPAAFIDQKIREISEMVGDNLAVNALSGGVDSSVVTMLGHTQGSGSPSQDLFY